MALAGPLVDVGAGKRLAIHPDHAVFGVTGQAEETGLVARDASPKIQSLDAVFVGRKRPASGAREQPLPSREEPPRCQQENSGTAHRGRDQASAPGRHRGTCGRHLARRGIDGCAAFDTEACIFGDRRATSLAAVNVDFFRHGLVLRVIRPTVEGQRRSCHRTWIRVCARHRIDRRTGRQPARRPERRRRAVAATRRAAAR